MVTPNEHTQSLSDFRENLDQTIERVSRTGAAEVLTVDGRRKAVLITPEDYDQLGGLETTEEDLENIRISIEQFSRGEGIPIAEAFAQIRERLPSEQNKS